MLNPEVSAFELKFLKWIIFTKLFSPISCSNLLEWLNGLHNHFQEVRRIILNQFVNYLET